MGSVVPAGPPATLGFVFAMGCRCCFSVPSAGAGLTSDPCGFCVLSSVRPWRGAGELAQAQAQYDDLSSKKSSDHSVVLWDVGHCAAFAEGVVVTSAMARGFGLAFELQPAAEKRLLETTIVSSVDGQAPAQETRATQVRARLSDRRQ